MLVIPPADTLADHCGEPKLDCRAGRINKGCDRVCNGVCCNGRGAEGGHQPLHDQFADLKHSIFHAVGHADFENSPDHVKMQLRLPYLLDMDRIIFMANEHKHNHSSHRTRDEGSGCSTRYAPMEAIDQHSVAADVDDIH